MLNPFAALKSAFGRHLINTTRLKSLLHSVTAAACGFHPSVFGPAAFDFALLVAFDLVARFALGFDALGFDALALTSLDVAAALPLANALRLS